jgi:hypothetical protein
LEVAVLDVVIAQTYDQGRLRGWLDESMLEPRTGQALRAWFADPAGSPFVLEPFLRPDRADAVAAAIARIRSWEHAHAFANDQVSYEVPRQEWESAEPARRFFRHDIARPMTALTGEPDQRTLVELLTLVASGALCRWLGTAIGTALHPLPTLEITRYHRGDFIRRHDDTFTDRVLAANLYLDGGWQPGDGGCLELVRGAESARLVEPRFNRLALIPIAVGYQHAVLPWTSDKAGRFTVSMGIRRAPA